MTSWWVTVTDEEFTVRFQAEKPRLRRETFGKPAPMVGDEIVVTNYSRLGIPKTNTAYYRFDRWSGSKFDLAPRSRGTRAVGLEQGYVRDLVDFESMGW